jgi:multiple sugar transport system substrate-binding protein
MHRKVALSVVAMLCIGLLALPALPALGGGAVSIKAVWMEYDARYNTFWQQLKQDFEKTNAGITVDTVVVPWSEGHDRLVTWIAGNQAPDIAIVGTRWILEFNKMGVVEPVDTLFPKPFLAKFIGPALEARINGRLYGVPVALSARSLYYRTDLVKKPPETWQDLLSVAQQVNKPPDVYGIGVSGKKFAELTEYVYYLYGNGGDFFTINADGGYGKCRVNDAAGVGALQFMVDLANKYKVTEPNVGENDRGTLQDLFLAGKLAMIETGPWFGGMVQERAKNLQFAVAPMPYNQGKKQQTLLVTDSIIVFKSSKNKDAVVKFLEFAYGDPRRLEFDKDFGMLPTETSVSQNAFFQTAFYKPFIQQLPTAKPWPLMAEWSKVEDVMWDAVTAALLNTKAPQQALNDACREIDQSRGVK